MAKILVVDDDPDFVRATKLVLEKNGHEVVTAGSGDSGYRQAKEQRPAMVVLDVIMDTVLDGLSVTQRMHDDPELSEIPIIMVTSIANTDYAELFPTDEFIHINAFLSKPFSAEALMKQVNKYLPKG